MKYKPVNLEVDDDQSILDVVLRETALAVLASVDCWVEDEVLDKLPNFRRFGLTSEMNGI
jgi:hypothetical protein